jgi:hypothetical protein
MNEIDENIDWKKEAPLLASLSRSTPFCVHPLYFEELQDRIHQSVFVDGLMQKDHQCYTIPENYFEELGANISAKIAIDKFKISADNDGFKTPVNYFDNLNAKILSKTAAVKPETKVLKLWSSDLMRYAAAACFILITASGLYVNQLNTLKQNRNTEIASEQVLYDIDESVIIEHLIENQSLTSVSPSDTELENYILNHYSANDLANGL